MIILDTNTISETTKRVPSSAVKAWFQTMDGSLLFTTSVTEAELLVGIELMAAGARRDDLRRDVNEILYQDLAGRILPFDSGAAHHYAEIFASRRRAGRQIDAADAQIAAIARSHGFAVATRNVSDFEACGIELINPWS